VVWLPLSASGRGPGYTPLHLAAREGHEAAIRQLLDAGADVNAVDKMTEDNSVPDGWTPLHLAAPAGKTKAAKLLLDKGADANATDENGKLTPLHYTAWGGDIELVKVLLVGKAGRRLQDANGRTPLDLVKIRKHSAVVKLLEKTR
jgi:ankyrin repeat protein